MIRERADNAASLPASRANSGISAIIRLGVRSALKRLDTVGSMACSIYGRVRSAPGATHH